MDNSQFGRSNQNLMDILEKYPITGASGAGLAIGSDTAKVKTATAIYYFIGGKLYTLAATDDLITLSGTVHNSGTVLDMINVFVFSVDYAGTVIATMGTEALALADVVFPVTPVGEVVIGFLIIDLGTGAGSNDFVGGTTALDDGTVVPSAVYIDSVAPMRFGS